MEEKHIPKNEVKEKIAETFSARAPQDRFNPIKQDIEVLAATFLTARHNKSNSMSYSVSLLTDSNKGIMKTEAGKKMMDNLKESFTIRGNTPEKVLESALSSYYQGEFNPSSVKPTKEAIAKAKAETAKFTEFAENFDPKKSPEMTEGRESVYEGLTHVARNYDKSVSMTQEALQKITELKENFISTVKSLQTGFKNILQTTKDIEKEHKAELEQNPGLRDKIQKIEKEATKSLNLGQQKTAEVELSKPKEATKGIER